MEIQPIGTLHTPHETLTDMPIQPKGAMEIEGHALLLPQYEAGLKDLEGFTHLYLIYAFHEAQRTEMEVIPFMDKSPRGVFATRSPLRPSHIGLSIVRLTAVRGNRVHFLGADMLNNTPLIDIKPYVEKFDAVKESRSGWMQASQSEVNDARSDGRFK